MLEYGVMIGLAIGGVVGVLLGFCHGIDFERRRDRR